MAFRPFYILAGIWLLLICAGEASGAGEKIAEVAVKGNRRIEASSILNVLKSKAGETLFPEKVDQDIRTIYALGHFQDVAAESTPADKGVTLTFTVVEKPVVREVKIEGTSSLSEEKVREAIEVRPNTIYSAKDLARSVRKVKKLYSDEGYYLAEVATETARRSPTEVRVVFRITEGRKILIRRIVFEGNRAFPAKKLKGAMETGEEWFLSWLTGAGTYKEDVLKSDVAAIADLYFNNGYVTVKVGEPKVELQPDRQGLQVTIGITEGEQYRVGRVDFKGDLLETREALAGRLTLKTGDTFSRMALRTDVVNLTDLYADQGYAFANITPQTKLNAESRTVDVTFDMERGEKVHIDRINISGNTKTRDKVIRRELKLAEGELYSSTALKRSKQALMNLGYFEEANLATAKGSANDKLNLNVEVKEKPTGTFSIGAGYSSLDGLIGQGSVQQANFMGLGLKLNAAAALGGKSQTYNLGITDPYFLDTKWMLGGDIYRTERTYSDSYKRRATGFDVKGGYPLSDHVSTFMLYRYEEKKIFDKSQDFLAAVDQGLINDETSSTTSSITASLTRNTTDYRFDPSRGMVNNLSLEFAGIGGTNHYLRTVGDTAVFFPLFWNAVFSQRAAIGYIARVKEELAIDEKFYLGGINTLRGYKGRTVSPYRSATKTSTDILGHVTTSQANLFVGGDTQAYFNSELTFPLIKEAGLKGVIFFDIGNAYERFDEIFSRFQASYGIGIRWFSPMGPLRLEYGIPINRRPDIDETGRLEFSIGTFF